MGALTTGNISEGVVEVDMAFESHVTCFSFLLRPVFVQSELQESHKATVMMLIKMGFYQNRKKQKTLPAYTEVSVTKTNHSCP